MADLHETITKIRYHNHTRNYAMEQRKRVELSLGAYLRTQLGWSRYLEEPERKKIAEQAQALIKQGELMFREEHPAQDDNPIYGTIFSSLDARKPFDRIEKFSVKEMERLARTLPAWAAFGHEVRGFGARSLAVIVGEAGDLSGYATHSKLWKRMGLAVIDGVRQGGLKKGASAEDWIAHGYSPVRRSRMFVIGEALVKVGAHYREVYLKRKEYERERLPEAKPIVTHRRAQRYMEKRLLRDLWRAWRQACVAMPDTARLTLPAANH